MKLDLECNCNYKINIIDFKISNCDSYFFTHEEFGYFYEYYILNNEKYSFKGLNLKKTGWVGNRWNYYIKNNPKLRFLGFNRYKDFSNYIPKISLCYCYDTMIYHKNASSHIKSVLNHIRNSLAHGLFQTYSFNNKKYIIMQDKNRTKKINMFAILSKEFLFELTEIIFKKVKLE